MTFLVQNVRISCQDGESNFGASLQALKLAMTHNFLPNRVEPTASVVYVAFWTVHSLSDLSIYARCVHAKEARRTQCLWVGFVSEASKTKALS